MKHGQANVVASLPNPPPGLRQRSQRKRWSFGGVTFDPQSLRKDTTQRDPRPASFSMLRDQAAGEGELKRRALVAQQDFLLGV